MRQIANVLRTRLPLLFTTLASNKEAFDLHALDTPPAFILSQDQTLSLNTSILTLKYLYNLTIEDPILFHGHSSVVEVQLPFEMAFFSQVPLPVLNVPK